MCHMCSISCTFEPCNREAMEVKILAFLHTYLFFTGQAVIGLNPHSLTSILWAMAKLGYRPHIDLLDSFQKQAKVLLHGQDIQDDPKKFGSIYASQLIWSLAQLRYMPDAAFLEVFEGHVEKLIGLGDLRAQETANTVLSLAKLGVKPGKKFAMALNAAVIQRREEFINQGLYNAMWGLCLMEVETCYIQKTDLHCNLKPQVQDKLTGND